MLSNWMRSASLAAMVVVGAGCGAEVQEGAELTQDQTVFETTFEVDESGEVKQGITYTGPEATVIGFYDSQENGRARGWACAPYYPNTYLNIRISKYYSRQTTIGTVTGWEEVGTGTANVLREAAVGANCGGNPYHGFDISFGYRGYGTYRMRAFSNQVPVNALVVDRTGT